MGHEAKDHRSGNNARRFGRDESRIDEGKNRKRSESSVATKAERRAKSSPRGAHGQRTACTRLVGKAGHCEGGAPGAGLGRGARGHWNAVPAFVARWLAAEENSVVPALTQSSAPESIDPA